MPDFDAFDYSASASTKVWRFLLSDQGEWIIEAVNTALAELLVKAEWVENGTCTADQAVALATEAFLTLQPGVDMLGMILPFASSITPVGCLPCDGSEVLQTDYPDLYALIGSTFGSADAGYFRIPDLRGRTVVGTGQGPGLTNRNLADSLGEEAHTLVSSEMPTHTHTDTGHTHTTGNSLTGVAVTPGELPVLTPNPIPAVTGVGNAANANTGGGGAHNNMQPSLALTYVIVAIHS